MGLTGGAKSFMHGTVRGINLEIRLRRGAEGVHVALEKRLVRWSND